MKFFRQKSSHRKSVTAAHKCSVESFDDIVKTVRNLLTKNAPKLPDSSRPAEQQPNSTLRLELEKLRLVIIDSIGETDREDSGDERQLFADRLFSSEILLELVRRLPEADFESKKLMASIVRNALLLKVDNRFVTVDYIANETSILFNLVDSYGNGRSDITLNCGQMLRDCVGHESLARVVLRSQHFYKFFNFVNQTTFDVSMDAFVTFRCLLTRHKTLASEFLANDYKLFFERYYHLIRCDNYVTKRQSLEILGLMLANERDMKIRALFIADYNLMRLVMNLLWHRHKHIRFRALNIFNIMVNSDEKPYAVMAFLLTSKDKLVEVFSEIRGECSGGQIFADQKPFVNKMITELMS